MKLKYLKSLILLTLVSASGCSSTNISKLAAQLKNDPATVNMSVQSVYGTIKFTRTNPGTNSTVTVSPDGTVTVKRE